MGGSALPPPRREGRWESLLCPWGVGGGGGREMGGVCPREVRVGNGRVPVCTQEVVGGGEMGDLLCPREEREPEARVPPPGRGEGGATGEGLHSPPQ